MLTVLKGATLIDGTGNNPVSKSTVLIKGSSIEWIGLDSSAQLPQECEVIDITGKTLMPGMIDLHVHLLLGEHDIVVPGAGLFPGLNEPWPIRGIKSFSYARKSLEMGFTTLRDVGDMGNVAVSVRNAVNAGIVEGPRIFSCGQWLTATGGHADLMPSWLVRTDCETNVADGIDGVVKAVRRQWKMKVDWIKFYATGGIMDPEDRQEFTDEEMKALVNEAHSKDKPVCAHCFHAQGTLAAVKAGVDTLEHGVQLTEEIVDMMIEKGATLVPTLNTLELMAEKGSQFGLPAIYVERMKPYIEIYAGSFRMALKAGVKIALGTDAGFNTCFHGNNALELEYLVKHGLSPMQTILAATRNAADALGQSDKLGTIEPGKLADMVVVDGNPLEDIKILQEQSKIALVMKSGLVCINRMSL